jgi:S-adenosyl-L-methionine hydrolase (adenosine-forming)
MDKRRAFVSFLSDYGLEDEFVGVCHGVMLRIAPHLKIVDVHHNILRQDVRHGAIVLCQAVPYLPGSLHLAIVDPTVGSNRRAVAIESGSGETFIGPDNGLLVPAAELCGGVARAHEITNQKVLLGPVSHTFQGRDVFAPSAAHLANGMEMGELGPAVDPADLVRLQIPEAWIHDDHLHAQVLQLDRFGNLQLNFGRAHLAQLGLADGPLLGIRIEGQKLKVPYGRSFTDVSPGEFILVEDSYHQLSLAVNKGDAAAKLQAAPGSTVIIGPAGM